MQPFIAYPLFIESPLQLGIIFLVVLIVFGPGKLPQVFRSLGEGVKQFKDAASAPNTPQVNTTPAAVIPPGIAPAQLEPAEPEKLV